MSKESMILPRCFSELANLCLSEGWESVFLGVALSCTFSMTTLILGSVIDWSAWRNEITSGK